MPPNRTTAFIALGANMGDPEQQIRAALKELGRLPETSLSRHSPLYRSRAEGYLEQPDFINAVAEIQTLLPPRALLDELLTIEQRHGRQRSFRNAPRTLDLDILLYGDKVLDRAGLHLPHPRMHLRTFVLLPLSELAPEVVIPGQGTVRDCLARLSGRLPERLSPGNANDLT